jgi:hypothetical protein
MKRMEEEKDWRMEGSASDLIVWWLVVPLLVLVLVFWWRG